MTDQILVYYGKHATEFWFARTPEERDRAFLALFKRLDETCRAYTYEHPDEIPKLQRKAIASARGGNPKAAEFLLKVRQHYEYERWSLETVNTP